MRNKWIGTGWKMNFLSKAAEEYAVTLKEFALMDELPFTAFVLPPFTSLQLVAGILENTTVLVGAQNMHWEEQGAFTGEISPLMLTDSGAKMVEIGHSERRVYFNETDNTVNFKVRSALEHGLIPVVCIGETAEERNYGVAYPVLSKQVRWAIAQIPVEQISQVIFAYEPVWAIGTGGVAAEAAYVSEIHSWIRAQITELAGELIAEQTAVIYGGSVNKTNMIEYLKQRDVDGLFIGRAAWQVEAYIQILLEAKRFLGK